MGVAGGGQIHLQRSRSNLTLCPQGHRFTFKVIFVEEEAPFFFFSILCSKGKGK